MGGGGGPVRVEGEGRGVVSVSVRRGAEGQAMRHLRLSTFFHLFIFPVLFLLASFFSHLVTAVVQELFYQIFKSLSSLEVNRCCSFLFVCVSVNVAFWGGA